MPPNTANEAATENSPIEAQTPADKTEAAPPPRRELRSSLGFIFWRSAVGGLVMAFLFLLPLGDFSFYAVPICVAIVGFLVGMRSYESQREPFIMIFVRHGAWGGTLTLVPLALLVFVLTSAEIFEQAGLEAADAEYAPLMVALGLCCGGAPFAMVLGGLAGVGGMILADWRNNPID